MRRLISLVIFSVICLMTLCLSACSPYKHSFNCPVPKGYPCTSMSRIHELIDEGVFASQNPEVNCKTCSKGSCHSKQASGTPDWVEAVILSSNRDEPQVRKYVVPLETTKP